MTAEQPVTTIGMDEFCRRFKAEMVAKAGEGAAEYAEREASAYWEAHREDGTPEECAQTDISYWGKG